MKRGKWIKGYKGLYSVTKRGKVWSIRKMRFLKGNVDCWGYPSVGLRKNGKSNKIRVHQLVCRAFHGKPPSPEHEVAHWDGVRTNNYYKNLRWATSSENSYDSIRHGTRVDQVGVNNSSAKLTEEDVIEIRAYHRIARARLGKKKTKLQAKIAKFYGVVPSRISHIVTGRHWKHLL